MVYTARLVVIGKTGKDLFAGFVLASGSLPYRRMEARCGKDRKKKIYVIPRMGHEEDNIKHPDVDNYACVIGSKISKIKEMPQDITGSVTQEILADLKKYAIVSFNGHMCKRCMANIEDGMQPEIALDSTLFEFRGLKDDARIGGVIYVDEGLEMGFLGINDIDRVEKRIKGYKLRNNLGVYTYVKDTSLEKEVEIPTFDSANDLSRYISTEMIPNAEKVLAGGVCILRKNEFETGFYNTPTEQIECWTKK